MNIQPITPTTPNCFGVLCQSHGQCARYRAIDGAPAHIPRIGTCDLNGTGERPLFVAVEDEA